MSPAYDVCVIGAGHNGLVCAAALARSGRRVLVLEAAARLGGAAASGEFAAGFKVSKGAHVLHMLHPRVVRELELERHGLRLAARRMTTVALARDGAPLLLHAEPSLAAQALRPRAAADAAELPDFLAQARRFAGVVQRLQDRTPPRLASGRLADGLGLARLGWSVRRLGRDDMREFLRVIGMNIADLLEERFGTDLLRGALALDAVLGTRLGPRSPNTVFTWLYRLAGERRNGDGLSLPAGGMGAVAEALAAAARRGGADIRTGAEVARILVSADRAAGVQLVSGEEIAAGCVVSSADLKRTLLALLGVEHLDTGVVRRVRALPTGGQAAKLHLALDALPSFTGTQRGDLGGRLVIAPDVDYVERAFNHGKYGEYSEAPAVEITIPSVHDASLAPAGKHVLSAVVQYAPYDLRAGWHGAREAFQRTVIQTIAAYAPDIESKILHAELLTPPDLEREFGITGGHWHHAELGLERFLMLRPVPGMAQYATPVPGLFLCGADCHPGGGVMGAAGLNAAREIAAQTQR